MNSPAIRLLASAILVLLTGVTASPQTDQSLPVVPETIPIFPLQEIMLFPQASRALHIFEPRYREMVADALEGGRIIGMVMLRPGHEDDYYGRPPVYDIGCAGVIADVQKLEDGRYLLVLRGLSKFRVTQEDSSRSYRLARVVALPETLSERDAQTLRQKRPLLLELLSRLAPSRRLSPDEMSDEMSDEMLVNTLAQTLRMEPAARLDLLQKEGALARALALGKLFPGKQVAFDEIQD